jgi:antitoxin ParD1/3/4
VAVTIWLREAPVAGQLVQNPHNTGLSLSSPARFVAIRLYDFDTSRQSRAMILGKIWQEASPMSTMNISLPDALKSFVDEQVNQRGYGTSSEYVRELIRKDQDRQHLRGLLLAGAASAPAAPADADYFESLRARVRNAQG